MHTYDTLVDAINDLRKRGYTEDLKVQGNYLVCGSDGAEILPEQFQVDEFYRFEGDTNPSDMSILIAISSQPSGRKGILVDAYGTYSENLTSEMLERLRYPEHPNQ